MKDRTTKRYASTAVLLAALVLATFGDLIKIPAILPARADPIVPAMPPNVTTLFFDNFESTADQWALYEQTVNGVAEISSAEHYNGAKSLKLYAEADGDGFGYTSATNSTAYHSRAAQIWESYWLKVTTLDANPAETATTMFSMMTDDEEEVYLEVGEYNDSAVGGCNWTLLCYGNPISNNLIALNAWHLVEMRLTSGGVSYADKTVSLFVDGVWLANDSWTSMYDYQGFPIDRQALIATTIDSTAGANTTLYFDDYGLYESAPSPAEPNWASFGHDPTHSAITTSNGPTTSVLAWSESARIVSPALENMIIYNDVCYFPLNDGRYFALNATTGATIWENDSLVGVDQFGVQGFAYDSGKLYLTGNIGWLYCFNATDGYQLWSASLGASSISNPAVANNIVYAGSNNHTLFAFAADSGAPVWTATMPAAIYTSPAIDSGMVFITSFNGNTSAFDALTGALVWSYFGGSSCDTSPTVSDGRVFSNDISGNAVALDETTGSLIWTNFTATTFSTAAVGYGYVYYPTTEGIFALDVATGDIVWTYDIMSDSTCSMFVPALSANRILYVAEQDNVNYLYGQIDALDATTGNQLWVYNAASGAGFGSPALANNTLIAVDDIGEVFAWTYNSTLVPPTSGFESTWMYLNGGNYGWKYNNGVRANYLIADDVGPFPFYQELFDDARMTCKDSNGVFHALFVADDNVNDKIYYFNSTDNGATWVETKLTPPLGLSTYREGFFGTVSGAIVAGSNGEVWAVMSLYNATSGYSDVVVARIETGSFAQVTDLDSPTSEFDMAVQAVVDYADNLHVAWTYWALPRYIEYCRFDNALQIWGPKEVAYEGIGWYTWLSSIDVDTSNHVHMAIMTEPEEANQLEIVYTNRSVGVVGGWSQQEILTHYAQDGPFGYPSVCVVPSYVYGGTDVLHILCFGPAIYPPVSVATTIWDIYRTIGGGDDSWHHAVLNDSTAIYQGQVVRDWSGDLYYLTTTLVGESSFAMQYYSTSRVANWTSAQLLDDLGTRDLFPKGIYQRDFDYVPPPAPPPDVYWFNFTFYDRNSDLIPNSEFNFAWSYYGNGSSLVYTLGDATLAAGTYFVLIDWKGIDISDGGFIMDTATYGNQTFDFGTMTMLPWQGGYIRVNNGDVTITINDQTSNVLNVTISGASWDYNTTISGYDTPPALVQLNGTTPTYDYNSTEQTLTIVSDHADDSVFYIAMTAPAPDRYWFNCTFSDQNGNPIPTNEFTFTWAYDDNGSSLFYTLGETTLAAGTYDVTAYWKGINLITLLSGGSNDFLPLDTTTYGNQTVPFPRLPMLPWKNGYVFVSDISGATIAINSQDDTHLNVTVAGANGAYNTTISGYTKDPATVKLNDTNADYAYSVGQETVTVPSNGTDDSVIYIEPAASTGGNGDGSGSGGGGSWTTPIVNAAQSVIDAIKKIPLTGIYAIIAVLALVAVGGMFGGGKGSGNAPSRSFRKRK